MTKVGIFEYCTIHLWGTGRSAHIDCLSLIFAAFLHCRRFSVSSRAESQGDIEKKWIPDYYLGNDSRTASIKIATRGGRVLGYNWEGDLILQDTAVAKKRYVIGRREPITTDIREWISCQDHIIIRQILAELREKGGLPATKRPGDFDNRAMVVWRFVTGNIRYVYDTKQYKKDDFWLFPPETFQIGKGDCEDGSFLMASLLIACGISPFCVRVVLGRAYAENNNLLGGHCWPVYKNESGRWCILESTLEKIPSLMPDADELAREGRSFRYEPLYCFNGNHLWEIFPEGSTKPGRRSLRKYFKARTKRVDMRIARKEGI